MLVPLVSTAAALAAVVLEGIAVLPADSRMPGPDSGHFITGLPGVEPPFDGQPLQGVSSVIAETPDSLLILTDNGYGARDNSADFLLRIFSVTPAWRSVAGGSGSVRANGFVTLKDPFDFAGFERVADRKRYYPNTDNAIADPTIAQRRWLTGADFDPECMVRHPDGTFWIGDEFGPYLLHFSADGRLLEPPYTLPGLTSPDRPGIEPGTATLERSKGFEGMALSPDGDHLYAMLEAGMADSAGVLPVYTFDIGEQRFVNADATEPSFTYRMEEGATAIGEFILFAPGRGLVIERDSGQGAAAKLKKVFSVELGVEDDEGHLAKVERVDLLDIHDPDDLDRDGSTSFSFPHQTIESLAVIGSDRLIVVNDNNYPFGRARSADRPDATEFIVLRVEKPW